MATRKNALRTMKVYICNVDTLSKALKNDNINSNHFTAQEVGMAGASLSSLVKHGNIKVVDTLTSFIPIDSWGEEMYKKISINVYGIDPNANTNKNINKYRKAILSDINRMIRNTKKRLEELETRKQYYSIAR